jgi:hypothetical protein
MASCFQSGNQIAKRHTGDHFLQIVDDGMMA